MDIVIRPHANLHNELVAFEVVFDRRLRQTTGHHRRGEGVVVLSRPAWPFDSVDELQEFETRGRVTGYFEAFAAPDGRTPVSTGAHLFRDDAGAKEFLARFAERYKRLAGGTIGPQRIESVNDVAAPTLGDGAVAVALAIPGAHRVTVLVRRGRVVGETVVVRTDDAQARAEALDLARKLDARTTSALKR